MVEAGGGPPGGRDRVGQVGHGVRAQIERPAGASQLLVRVGERLAQPAAAVRREQVEPAAVAGRLGQEPLEREVERLRAQEPGAHVVGDREPRVEARVERVGPQDAQAEAVDGRDPGRVDRARPVHLARQLERLAHAPAKLRRRPVGERDREHPVDRRAAQHLLQHPLDQHGGLAGARPRPRRTRARGARSPHAAPGSSGRCSRPRHPADRVQRAPARALARARVVPDKARAHAR